MKYIEVTIYTHRENIDPLTCILMDMGIAGFVVSDPADVDDFLQKKNTYDWDYVSEEVLLQKQEKPGVTFYLDDDEGGSALLEKLQEFVVAAKPTAKGETAEIAETVYYELTFRTVDDEEWKDNWKEYFKPAHITHRIVVKPTWEDYEKAPDELVIEMDPGMAFGTGTHPTTSLCVKLLEKYIESTKDVVLDVGCGSGILSIASALLGVKRTIGVEIDPVAVSVATANVERNGLSHCIEIRQGDLTKGLDIKADIVAANLMADLVIMLSADVAKHLSGKSIYISSGILIEKQGQVVDAIRGCGFEIIEILEEGDWCAIAAHLPEKE